MSTARARTRHTDIAIITQGITTGIAIITKTIRIGATTTIITATADITGLGSQFAGSLPDIPILARR